MQRERREKSYKSSNLFLFFTLTTQPELKWQIPIPRIKIISRNVSWLLRTALLVAPLLQEWIQRVFALKSSIMLPLFNSHVIYLKAIVSPASQPSTRVWHETLMCRVLSAPGYQSSRCWCWCGMRMLSTSLSQYKWTWWRWWLRAVINALWGSAVAIQGYPRVVFVAHFFTENRCWFCHLLMFPCRIFHTIFTW